MNTRSLDLVPIQRFAVGYDRLFNDIDRLYSNSAANQTYPPYNIIKEDENHFLIEIAAAGFKDEDLEVTVDQGQLVVQCSSSSEDEKNYVHRGIAMRNFTRTFRLADHIEVVGAMLANGLLTIKLERIVPEELKPRRIEIKS